LVRLLGAFLPSEDTARHDPVEPDLVQGPKEDVTVDLALADVQMLMHPCRGAGLTM
jgi:hypothetical protein